MSENTVSILTPSVNNLTVRVLVRVAGLDFEERDVWGKKDEPAFIDGDYDIHWLENFLARVQ